jgi:hypothetical protein
VHAQFKTVLCRYIPELDNTRMAIDTHRTSVSAVPDGFHTRDGPRGRKPEQLAPLEWPPIAQPHSQRGRISRDTLIVAVAAQLTRRPAVSASKRVVETPDAAIASRSRDLSHWQRGLVNQALGKMQTLRMSDCEWTGTKMLRKQTPQVTTGYAETIRQLLNTAVIKRAAGNQP